MMNIRDNLIAELKTINPSYVEWELRLASTKRLVALLLAEHKFQSSIGVL